MALFALALLIPEFARVLYGVRRDAMTREASCYCSPVPGQRVPRCGCSGSRGTLALVVVTARSPSQHLQGEACVWVCPQPALAVGAL